MSDTFPITENDRRTVIVASPGQTALAGDFPLQDDDDVRIVKTNAAGVESTLVITTHYTLSGVGSPSGFTATLVTPAVTGDSYRLDGMARLTRTTSIVRDGKFSSKPQDDEHDRHRLIAQELRRDVDRSIRANHGVTVPRLKETLLAGHVPMLAPDGLSLVNGPSADELAQVEEVAATAVAITRFRRFDVTNWLALPANSAAQNVARIQATIDAAYAEAGGKPINVYVPMIGDGIYQIQSSTLPDMLGFISAGPVFSTAPASSHVCLLLRPGVTLVLEEGVTLHNIDNTRNIIGFKMMTGGGVIGGRLMGSFNWAAPVTGAGHGIFSFCDTSPNNDPNENVLIRGVEICNVASYGIGMQHGYMRRNRILDCWIHDNGADGIDWKARPKTDGTKPYGNVIDIILVERHGRRSGVIASAGIDARGQVSISNITVREHAYNAQGNVGVRLSAGIAGGGGTDLRESSRGAVLSSFYIDALDPTNVGTIGVVLLDSGGIVGDGTIRNCDLGVNIGGASSGWGSNAGALVHDVIVEGARTRGFSLGDDRISVHDCVVMGQIETFEATHNNLADGQTVFVSPRPFDPSVVEVYYNGVLLTLTTDYTVTGSNTITLTSGVIVTDVVDVVSPTALGYDIIGKHVTRENCRALHVITEKAVSGSAFPTLHEDGNIDERLFFIADASSSTTAVLQARSATMADGDFEIQGKGIGGATMRSLGQRAFRAVNASADVRNWVQAAGGVLGAGVEVQSQGESINIPIIVRPKASYVEIDSPLKLKSYTVATVPLASLYAGSLIYVADGTANKRLAVSDATNWRWPDGAIVT